MSRARDDAQREAREDRLLGSETEPLVTNAADATQIKAARKSQKRVRTIELEDIRDAVKTPGGRRFIWRVLQQCGTFESTFSSTAGLSQYNAGRQDIGHFLLSELTHAQPDLLPALMAEAYKEK